MKITSFFVIIGSFLNVNQSQTKNETNKKMFFCALISLKIVGLLVSDTVKHLALFLWL